MTSNALVPIADIERMAQAVAKSGLFGMKTMDQALALMLLAQAEGMHPALAARDYHVIQGRPALKADAMLARFQQAGGMVEWQEYTDTKVVGLFSHPQACPKPLAVEWTIEMAKRIGLTGKDNWKHYPRAMLRARVISEGIRTVYPGVAVGLYTVEEVIDFAKEKDITPSAGVAERLNPEQHDKIKLIVDKVTEWLNSGSVGDAVAEAQNANMEADEYVYFWTFFDSKQRSAMKKENERVKAKHSIEDKSGLITDAQKKRMEARISELACDREQVKQYCKAEFGKEHFAELTKQEYERLDDYLGANPKAAAQDPGPSVSTGSSLHDAPPPGSAQSIDDEKIVADVDKFIASRKFKAAGDCASMILDATVRDAAIVRIQAAYDKVKEATV